MNELIRLLMEEAIRDVDVVYEEGNPLNDELEKMYIPYCFAEAFAHLVAKECLHVIIKSYRGHINPKVAADAVKTHFGIENE